ncbi:iron ABC transporter permease, partial [Ochrobactrum sp. SFR4]|uniref:FecCD family ABC transporter permease n=1 Tax=Ochrobactrum sp. SFR4 TaxID=2717368 RepID=UPI001C8CC955
KSTHKPSRKIQSSKAQLVSNHSTTDSFHETLNAFLGIDDVPRRIEVIVWQVRVPTALMAVLVGAALALAGTEMQTLLSNPLAEPFTLGISSCAALGAAVAIVLGVSLPLVPASWTISANAFLFAAVSLIAINLLASLRGTNRQVLVLFGIALGFTAGALLSLLQFIASADALQQLVFWSMGSLSRADKNSVLILAIVVVICVPFSFAASWRFTILHLGEERAKSLGIDLKRLRLTSLLRISLLSATAVAFVGIIGFVGLVGPHVARMLVGDDHRFLLPASMSVGAVVMLLASVASKVIVPGTLLPIGIVTALVGLPVFFLLILRQGGAER